eukprot:scaffold304073_cov30-Tisochrysis_lutea.AAC.1
MDCPLRDELEEADGALVDGGDEADARAQLNWSLAGFLHGAHRFAQHRLGAPAGQTVQLKGTILPTQCGSDLPERPRRLHPDGVPRYAFVELLMRYWLRAHSIARLSRSVQATSARCALPAAVNLEGSWLGASRLCEQLACQLIVRVGRPALICLGRGTDSRSDRATERSG